MSVEYANGYTMKLPSIKTLSQVFDNPKQARAVLEMTHEQLRAHPAGSARITECYHAPKWYDVRMHVLDSLDNGLYGLESIQSTNGEYADYLNAGDTYNPTVIYWRGSYRVQSIGDFIETMQRQSINFI